VSVPVETKTVLLKDPPLIARVPVELKVPPLKEVLVVQEIEMLAALIVQAAPVAVAFPVKVVTTHEATVIVPLAGGYVLTALCVTVSFGPGSTVD
jgi:hypothetical protein